MRKQFRGAMLALAALAGIVGQAQRVNSTQAVQQRGKDTSQAPASSVNAGPTFAVPKRAVRAGNGYAPVWMARAKRGNRSGRSRWDYGR